MPQHVASVPIRLMFNAKHTRSHSPRTFAKPRRVYRRNPSTSLIHPFGASESHLRCAYRALPVRLASFSTHAVRGREPGRIDRHPGLALTPQRDVRSRCRRFVQLQQIRLVAIARIGQYHRRFDPKRFVDPVEQPHQLTLIASLWPTSGDDDLVLPIDRHLRVVALLEPLADWSS